MPGLESGPQAGLEPNASGGKRPSVVPGRQIQRAAPWMSWVLIAAGVYNLLWGAWVVLLPNSFFDLVGMDRPNYPQLWQCIGMIVGVYGIGYLAAALDPLRHWPIVLVGLLGKIFGPIGFLDGVVRGELPPAFGATILTNDLIWWVPFVLILRASWRAGVGPLGAVVTGADGRVPELSASLERAITDRGRSVLSVSRDGPLLVVLLRHLGCTFCREAVADLALARARIGAGGASLILVHQSEPGAARAMFDRAGLAGVEHVSDPERRLYQAFLLPRGTLGQLFGPRVWWRGFRAGIVAGHLVGALEGDGFQMPGVFLLRDGVVVREYRHTDAADRPDYASLACAMPGVASVGGAADGAGRAVAAVSSPSHVQV